MQLTPEQLEKTARIAYETWYEGDLSWGEGSEVYKEDMRKAITAAFAAVEPPQVDVPGDLVERMLDVFIERSERAKMSAAWKPIDIDAMTAALRVALEDPRVLGEPTRDELTSCSGSKDNGIWTSADSNAVRKFLAARRARLLPPKTVEERVTTKVTSELKIYNAEYLELDGRELSYEELVDYARLGLIAKLKAEGTVSGEAGGNAQ